VRFQLQHGIRPGRGVVARRQGGGVQRREAAARCQARVAVCEELLLRGTGGRGGAARPRSGTRRAGAELLCCWSLFLQGAVSTGRGGELRWRTAAD
jgi:hypothetical protein